MNSDGEDSRRAVAVAWVVGDDVLHGRSMEARAKGKTAEKQDLAAAKIIRTTIARLYKARFKAEGEKLTVCVVIAPSYFELSIERGSTKSAMALPREYIEKFPDDTVAQIAGFLGNIHTIFVENKNQIDTVKTITAAAALLSRVYPAERVEKALEDLATRGVSAGTHELAKSEQRRDPVKVKAASRVMLRAQERGPRGPRVKPDPRLPETAPEIYRERKRREKLGRKKENIVQFLERVYAPWQEILKRADLRRLDPTADRAVNNWINTGKRLPKGLLLTEYELNTERRVQRRASLREDAPAQPSGRNRPIQSGPRPGHCPSNRLQGLGFRLGSERPDRDRVPRQFPELPGVRSGIRTRHPEPVQRARVFPGWCVLAEQPVYTRHPCLQPKRQVDPRPHRQTHPPPAAGSSPQGRRSTSRSRRAFKEGGSSRPTPIRRLTPVDKTTVHALPL
jgi:hypothetical protein